MMFMVSLTNF